MGDQNQQSIEELGERYRILTRLLTGYYFEYDVLADRLSLYGDFSRSQQMRDQLGAEGILERFSHYGQEHPKASYRDYYWDFYRMLTNQERILHVEWQLKRPDGQKLWLLVEGEKIFANDGETIRYVIGKFVDIGEQKEQQQRLLQLVQQDALTGAYNREAAFQIIAAKLKQWNDYQYFAFMMLDIDNFGRINETYGRPFGDRVLVQAVHLIRSLIREGDIIGRYDGDQFCIFLNGIPSEVEAGCVARRICNAFVRLFSEEEDLPEVSCSVGITVCNGGFKSTQQVYQEAQKALTAAKQAGRNGYSFFVS